MVEGFKYTEVGIIPNDWDASDIKKVIDKRNGIKIGPFGSQLKKELLTNSGYKVYGQENVYDNNMEVGDRYISKEYFKKLNSCEIKEGDFLISMMGTIGKCMIVPKKFEAGIMDSHLIRLRLDKEKLNSELLLHFFSSQVLINQVKKYSVGGIMDGLSSKIVKQIHIPLPPTKGEQAAIATALNDTDALINQFEVLLTKKRNIKTGAMQELLKPKEDWEEKTLRQVAKFRRGSFPQPYGLDKWYDDNDGFPFVQVYDVDDNMKLKPETKRRISKEAQRMSVFVKKGSILLTIQGSIGRIAMTQYDAYVDRTLLLFESYTVPFNHYFFMLLIYVLFEQEKQKAPGGTIKTITKEALSSFKISYPKVNEQNRIAQILSDMDNEIQELEKQIVKYKMMKQGMMQSLLTGKIRLV